MSKFIIFLFFIFYFYCQKSFEDINEWYRELKDNSNPTIKIILVGNKNDLERVVDKKEVDTIMDEFDIDLYLETSAKTGDNVEKLFVEAAKLLYKDYMLLHNINNNKDNKNDENKNKLLNLNEEETKKEENKSCYC